MLGTCARSGPSGRPVQDLLDQRQALLDLADPDPDPRIDVALVRAPAPRSAGCHRADRQASAARRRIGPRRGRHSRRRHIACASAGFEHAGIDGAILQRGGVVVEFDQRGKAPADVVERRPDGLGAVGVEVAGHAAGHDDVPHQAMAEGGVGGAQHALAQHAAMGVHQREGGVVADGADVAEMVGKPFEFGHQRAQPDRAVAARRVASAASAARENA